MTSYPYYYTFAGDKTQAKSYNGILHYNEDILKITELILAAYTLHEPWQITSWLFAIERKVQSSEASHCSNVGLGLGIVCLAVESCDIA